MKPGIHSLAQVATQAAAALGYLATGTGGALAAAAVRLLLGVAGTKSQPLMFAIGEALCFASGGAASIQPLSFQDRSYAMTSLSRGWASTKNPKLAISS